MRPNFPRASLSTQLIAAAAPNRLALIPSASSSACRAEASQPQPQAVPQEAGNRGKEAHAPADNTQTGRVYDTYAHQTWRLDVLRARHSHWPCRPIQERYIRRLETLHTSKFGLAPSATAVALCEGRLCRAYTSELRSICSKRYLRVQSMPHLNGKKVAEPGQTFGRSPSPDITEALQKLPHISSPYTYQCHGAHVHQKKKPPLPKETHPEESSHGEKPPRNATAQPQQRPPSQLISSHLSAEDVDRPRHEPLEHPPEGEVVVIRRHVLRYEPVPQQEVQPPHGAPHPLRAAPVHQRVGLDEAFGGLKKKKRDRLFDDVKGGAGSGEVDEKGNRQVEVEVEAVNLVGV